MSHKDFTELPCASPGLTSYRYRGPDGYIMIGAHGVTHALLEAAQRLTGDRCITSARLDEWDGEKYTPVTYK